MFNMADSNNQPTILVKRADGTFARMTLAEVKAMQTVRKPVAPKPARQVRPFQAGQKRESNLIKQQWTREDSRSLLEEKLSPPAVFHEPPTPATAAPFNSFAHKPALSAAPVAKRDDTMALKLNAQPQTRRLIRDIIPPRIDEIGPVQEIARLTLADLRRLATNPSEAASRLKQKLVNLRDESYLLYLEGLAAWRSSPLYLDYVKALAMSLDRRQTLAMLLTDKTKIQLAEIQALINMEKEL